MSTDKLSLKCIWKGKETRIPEQLTGWRTMLEKKSH